MPRVVLDSDDEEPDTTSPAKALLPPVATCSSNGDHSRVSGETGALASTTSTEKLSRELRTAHTALLETTPSGKRRAADDFGLPPLPSPKRRATASQKLRDTVHVRETRAGLLDASAHDPMASNRLRSSSVDAYTQQDDLSAVGGPSSTSPISSRPKHGNVTSSVSNTSAVSYQIDQRQPSSNSAKAQSSHESVGIRVVVNSLSEESKANSGTQVSHGTRKDDPVESIIQVIPNASLDHGPTRRLRQRSDRSGPAMLGKPQQLEQDDLPDELNSEDRAIGLPAEQYKPRPSRSRSVRTSADKQELLPLPAEKVRKVRQKRSKTTDGNDLSGEAVLRTMGFSNSQSSKALQEAQGIVEVAINNLLENKSTPSSTKRNHRSHAKMLSEDKGQAQAIEIKDRALEGPLESTIAVVDITQGVQHLAGEVLSGSEHKTGAESTAADEQIIVVKPLKGRGRPKKVQNPPKVVLQDQTVGENIADNAPGPVSASDSKPEEPPTEQRTRGRSKRPLKGFGGEVPKDVGKQITAETLDVEPTPEVQPEPIPSEKPLPEKPLKTDKKPHSPINKGKVPYKLGLSKRARVEPLLRRIKK